MKIAVLMSTYNGKQFLPSQLESLAFQTVAKDMTVYIRDDGSTDSTFEIIEQWKEKLDIVLYKAANVGPARSFWNLLENPDIQADYYAFCDQDDVWDKDKLEKAILKLQNHYDLWMCNCRIIDENGNVNLAEYRKNVPPLTLERLFINGIAQGCVMVFSDRFRRFLMKCHIQCIPMHDIIVNLYAQLYGKVYWEQQPCFSYRVHSNNVVAKSNKSLLKKMKTSYWNWKNSSKNSMADVAKELLDHFDTIPQKEQLYLETVRDYRKNIFSKLKLLRLTTFTPDVSVGAKRSFIIRTLLGLL